MEAEDLLSQSYRSGLIYKKKMVIIAIQEKNPTPNETKHIGKRMKLNKQN